MSAIETLLNRLEQKLILPVIGGSAEQVSLKGICTTSRLLFFNERLYIHYCTQVWGLFWVAFVVIFERSFLCSPGLHFFDKKTVLL